MCVRLLVYVAVLCMGACGGFLNPAAENVVAIRGRIDSVRPDGNCTLSLMTEAGRVASQATIRPVFSRSFVIAPGNRKYYAMIGCDGESGIFKSAVYESGNETKVMDLGTITLRR